jgi:hypothetical protein
VTAAHHMLSIANMCDDFFVFRTIEVHRVHSRSAADRGRSLKQQIGTTKLCA